MTVDLVPDIRASLIAKRRRLLSRPLIARIRTRAGGDREIAEEADGTFRIDVELDYDVRWRNREREVELEIKSAREMPIALLTDHQRMLLETSPGELFDRLEGPVEVTLVDYVAERVGGSLQVVSVRVASEPSPDARHVAVLPNLIQIQRQLKALEIVETSTRPELAPLQALVGRHDARQLVQAARARTTDVSEDGQLDLDQRAAVDRALASPHFSVIQGPPGSGKTTVITQIIRDALRDGERVLVVSPTHTAVDNVVEKLTARDSKRPDDLRLTSLPVRYAARRSKLTEAAQAYWVGANGQVRGETIAARLESTLGRTCGAARRPLEEAEREGDVTTPLSRAIAQRERVLCGTPIGLLSFDTVRDAEPGAFDCLIVDEVSKMSIAEFLAIAIKARRWVLVGDPAQLPPFNDVEANGDTLLDLLPATAEMVWSLRVLLEAPRDELIVAVSRDPAALAAAVSNELGAVPPCLHLCGPDEVEPWSAEVAAREPALVIRALVERDLPPPTFPAGSRRLLVEPRERAPAATFERAAAVYQAAPWASRAGQSLRSIERRTILPAGNDLVRAVALRFAVNAISVYDWLVGAITWPFEHQLLRQLPELAPTDLIEATQPYVCSLTRQYRMAPEISRVPRELFYFGEALQDVHDAPTESTSPKPQVRLIPVTRGDEDEPETNQREGDAIRAILDGREGNESRMVLTPYRKQEAHLRAVRVARPDELCTLDRCQGREADVVCISLVTGRSSDFLDSPKRWNVALTRAKKALFIVGDIDAYRRQARDARTRRQVPTMSVLARVIEAYDRANRKEAR